MTHHLDSIDFGLKKGWNRGFSRHLDTKKHAPYHSLIKSECPKQNQGLKAKICSWITEKWVWYGKAEQNRNHNFLDDWVTWTATFNRRKRMESNDILTKGVSWNMGRIYCNSWWANVDKIRRNWLALNEWQLSRSAKQVFLTALISFSIQPLWQ